MRKDCFINNACWFVHGEDKCKKSFENTIYRNRRGYGNF